MGCRRHRRRRRRRRRGIGKNSLVGVLQLFSG